MGYFTINQQPYGMHDPMGMRYGLPPGLYDPRMQLSGGRHKKVRGQSGGNARARLPVVSGGLFAAVCERARLRGEVVMGPSSRVTVSPPPSPSPPRNDGAESVKSCLSLFPWVLLTVGLGC